MPIDDDQRKGLIRSLAKAEQYPPFDIKCYPGKPNIYVMQIVHKYIKKCNVKI